MKSPITTHVLDTAIGRPAAGVRITLESLDGAPTEIGAGVTDDDGRITDLLEPGSLKAGTYRITFFVEEYLEKNGQRGFYPQVPVVFRVEATDEHYHVPLLLNPYGYSTYRGS
ncbi:MAG: hydroxyisourate hydrolase [Polyangiales bacterium]